MENQSRRRLKLTKIYKRPFPITNELINFCADSRKKNRASVTGKRPWQRKRGKFFGVTTKSQGTESKWKYEENYYKHNFQRL